MVNFGTLFFVFCIFFSFLGENQIKIFKLSIPADTRGDLKIQLGEISSSSIRFWLAKRVHPEAATVSNVL